MGDLRLRVNGKEYGGWKAVRVTRGIESVAGKFEVSVSDRWGGQSVPWPILEEDECTVLLDGHQVITGYVDQRRLSYSASDHELSVSGRDRTGALVDCSAVLTKWEYLNASLLAVATQLAKPFGIGVALQAGVGLPKPLPKLTIDPGDSPFDAIERACRMVGLLPISDGAGGLVLTRAGSARAGTALVEGRNILSASVDFDATGRFRTYKVVGQHQGSDEFSGIGPAAVVASATDPNVRRSARVLMVRAEGAVNPDYAKRRAQWEAKVRAGRGAAVSVRVQGWTQADGTLWPVNARVPVRSPLLGIDGELLITQVTHSLDGSGTTTDLSLKQPDAYSAEPVVTQASTARWDLSRPPMKAATTPTAPLPWEAPKW